LSQTHLEILQEIQNTQEQLQQLTEQKRQILACRSHPSPLAYYGSPYRAVYHQRLIKLETQLSEHKHILQQQLCQLEQELARVKSSSP